MNTLLIILKAGMTTVSIILGIHRYRCLSSALRAELDQTGEDCDSLSSSISYMTHVDARFFKRQTLERLSDELAELERQLSNTEQLHRDVDLNGVMFRRLAHAIINEQARSLLNRRHELLCWGMLVEEYEPDELRLMHLHQAQEQLQGKRQYLDQLRNELAALKKFRIRWL